MESASAEQFPLPVSFETLLAEKNDAEDEHVALQEQLQRFVLAQKTREKNCVAALANLQSQYESIILQAKDEAAKILAAAHLEASIIAANSAESALSAKRNVEEAEEQAKLIISTAKSEAQAIKEAAEDTSRKIRDEAAEKCVSMKAVVRREQVKWKEEQALVVDVQKFLPIVKLNVGGNRFDTSLTTMTRFRDTMIGTMFNGRHTLVQDTEGYLFIDRDGTHFRYILNFLRSPETFEVNLTEAALKELKSECRYYGLFEVMFPLTPVPSFLMKNKAGKSVEVTQGSDGVFFIEHLAVKYCTTCDRGEYSSYHSCVLKFSKTVKSNGGELVPEQPIMPTKLCRGCVSRVSGIDF